MRSGSGLLRWFCSVVVPIDIKGCKWIWYLTIWPTLPQAPQEKKLDRDSNSQQVQWTGMVRSSSSDVRYFLSRDLTFFDFECNPQGDGLCLFTVNVMKMILCYFMLFYDLISKSMFDIIWGEFDLYMCKRSLLWMGSRTEDRRVTCATMCSGIRTRTATEPLVAAMLSEWCLDLTREPEWMSSEGVLFSLLLVVPLVFMVWLWLCFPFSLGHSRCSMLSPVTCLDQVGLCWLIDRYLKQPFRGSKKTFVSIKKKLRSQDQKERRERGRTEERKERRNEWRRIVRR